jgi:O-antigen ligase
VYALALLVVAVLSWRRPDLALALPLVFAPLFMVPKHIGHQEFAPSEIFIVLDFLIALMWTLDRDLQRRMAWRTLLSSPFLPAVILFVLAGAASTLLAADYHEALRGYREWVVEPAAYFGLLLLFAVDLRAWRILFGGLIAAGVLVAIVGLIQRATHQDLSVDPGSAIQRVRSVYGSPDNVGLLLDRVIPVWLAVLLLARLDRPRRLLWYAVGALLVAVLILSYSRGAWAALAITCGAMLVLCRPWGRWVALAAIVVAVAVVGAKERSVAHALSAGHAGTAQNRVYIWKSGLQMLKRHPVFGIGPDNFIHYYAPTKQQDPYSKCLPGLGYLDREHAGDEPCLSHPHNAVLDFWLSTGVAGLVGFVWIEALFWRSIVAAYRRRAPGNALVVGAGGAMLAGLLHGLVDNSYFLPDLAVIFWFLCGFSAWLERVPAPWVAWVEARMLRARPNLDRTA